MHGAMAQALGTVAAGMSTAKSWGSAVCALESSPSLATLVIYFGPQLQEPPLQCLFRYDVGTAEIVSLNTQRGQALGNSPARAIARH